MMRGIWIYIAALLVLIGIVIREPAPTAIGGLILLTGGLSRLWSRAALARVEYDRSLPVKRAFVGESIEILFTLSNRKPLPVPWLEVRDQVPEKAPPEDEPGRPGGGPETLLLNRSTSLAWYERVRWRHRFRCNARGYFQFGPALLRSGDIFGLFPVAAEDPDVNHLTVLPRVLSLREIGLPSRRPFGEAATGTPIFEDQSRVVGLRDYRPGDPLKRIDWKATAKSQRLQSRLYDPAATLTMLIAVNVTTLEHPWEGYNPLLLERTITVAGSIASYAEEKRYAAGLVANCTFPNADRNIWLPPSRDPSQLTRILESLAMISPFVLAPIEDVLARRAERLPYGATVVIVAGFLTEGLQAYLSRGHASRDRWFMVWTGEQEAPDFGNRIQVYNASPHLRESEREWQAEHQAKDAAGAWSQT
jgi:uncharacterized protein (DUF58 family)